MSDAADRLFALGRPPRSVNERLEYMADNARRALEYLKNAESQKIRRMGRKQIGQWAARQVGCCVRTYQRTPPEDLVDLILFLHDADGPPKAIQPKGWRRVAHHKAVYPKKSTRDLAKLVH